jgi:hypothetical protein
MGEFDFAQILKVSMKKIFIFIIIFIATAAGYLYYDWNTKTKRAALEPSKTLYSWTDEKGVKHYTDKEPPRGAKDIEKTTGFKYVKPPLVTTIRRGAVNLYRRSKNTLSDFFKNIFKKRSKKTKNNDARIFKTWRLNANRLTKLKN